MPPLSTGGFQQDETHRAKGGKSLKRRVLTGGFEPSEARSLFRQEDFNRKISAREARRLCPTGYIFQTLMFKRFGARRFRRAKRADNVGS